MNIAKNKEILINNFEDLLEKKIATKIPDIVKQVKNDLQTTKPEKVFYLNCRILEIEQWETI